METFPKHNLAVQFIYAFNRFIAEWNICLGADLWQQESRELCACPGRAARATHGHLVPMFWWGHHHGGACIALAPHFPSGSPLQPLQGFHLSNGEEEKHHHGEIKSGSLTLMSWITMRARFPLTVRIWGAWAGAESSELYIPHPGWVSLLFQGAGGGVCSRLGFGWACFGQETSSHWAVDLCVGNISSSLVPPHFRGLDSLCHLLNITPVLAGLELLWPHEMWQIIVSFANTHQYLGHSGSSWCFPQGTCRRLGLGCPQ